MFKNKQEEKPTYLNNSFQTQLSQIMDLARHLTYIYEKKPDSILVDAEDQKESKLGWGKKAVTASMRMAAPEILAGNALKRNEKSDVFSFGILCYSLSTGKVPYDGFDAQQISDFVQKGKRLDIPENCPAKFASLIPHCWAQNPEDRPSMGHILAYFHSSLMNYFSSSNENNDNEFLNFKWSIYCEGKEIQKEKSLLIKDEHLCKFLNEGFNTLIGQKIHTSSEIAQVTTDKSTRLSFSQERILGRLRKLLQEKDEKNNDTRIKQEKEIIESKCQHLEESWKKENNLKVDSFTNSLVDLIQAITLSLLT